MMDNILYLNKKAINDSSYAELYESSLKQIDKLNGELVNANIDLNNLTNIKFDKISSNLDGYDYLFSIIFGILGATISSSKSIEEFCNQIHNHSSGKKMNNSNTLQAFIGDILKHKGDSIDKVSGSFINRNGQMADIGIHRLLWGHDILSLNKDNPFYLLVKQHGILQGVLQVFRHLIADTFSTQGLPLPGHSYFDYIKDNGKTSNLLSKLSTDMVNNDKIESNKNFQHLFTIRAQDVASQGLVWASSKAYFYARGIEDSTRMRQYKVLSYGTNFFAHAIIGTIRQNGIPYINWPALSGVIKEIAGLYIDSYKEIKQLELITNSIVDENIKIERQVFNTGTSLITYNSSDGYINELVSQDRIFNNLVDIFEEE